MQVDLQGRINNTVLPLGKPLLPVFEALVNSIHAIEDAGIKDGKITITIRRDENQAVMASEKKYRTIKHFEIEDNGIGFTDAQYSSFNTSDTTLKKNRGAKGIGRFMWLKAFGRVRVTSTFKDGSQMKERTFTFSLPGEGVSGQTLKAATSKTLSTTVILEDFATTYEKNCPKKLDTIAERVIEHCLSYFLSPTCPTITLKDDDEAIDLNSLFDSTIKGATKSERFSIKGKKFEIKHIRLYQADALEHTLHFCANSRDVRSVTLHSKFPALRRKLKDDKGVAFVYCGYISSEYLDSKVNPERTDFDLPRSGELLSDEEITEEELISNSVEKAKNHLQPNLETVREEMFERVSALIRNQMPELRPLLRSLEHHLDDIPYNADDSSLKLKLNEIQFRIEQELKTRSVDMLGKKPKSVTELHKYQEEYHRHLAQLNETTKTRLAQYIVHRKTMLELFEERLQLQSDGKYSREDAIHELIFPPKTTSDEVDAEDHNLWILDERLAFHYHLSSDKPLNSTPAKTDSKARPDLVVFNKPFAMTDSEEPINSVVLIEFKRP